MFIFLYPKVPNHSELILFFLGLAYSLLSLPFCVNKILMQSNIFGIRIPIPEEINSHYLHNLANLWNGKEWKGKEVY